MVDGGQEREAVLNTLKSRPKITKATAGINKRRSAPTRDTRRPRRNRLDPVGYSLESGRILAEVQTVLGLISHDEYNPQRKALGGKEKISALDEFYESMDLNHQERTVQGHQNKSDRCSSS